MRRLSLFLRRPLPAPHPSRSRPFSPPSLSCLFLFLSRLFALADCVPTFLPLPLRLARAPHSFSFSPRSRARARNRTCGCARSCLVVSLPRLASPYLPAGATASRVIAARYREFLRLLATRRFLPWRHHHHHHHHHEFG